MVDGDEIWTSDPRLETKMEDRGCQAEKQLGSFKIDFIGGRGKQAGRTSREL